jgi:VWFA-related protein
MKEIRIDMTGIINHEDPAMKRLLPFLAVAAVCPCFFWMHASAPVAGAQEQEEVKKIRLEVRTDLMEVRVVVADKSGRIVENLGKDDFELLENGKAQDIGFFTVSRVDDVPGREHPGVGTAGLGGPAGAEEQKNRPKPVGNRLNEPPVRTTLLFVDNLHLSFSNLNWVKRALDQFISERMTDQDLVALATSHSLGVSQQYTRDRQLLKYAVEQIRFGAQSGNTYFTPNLAAMIHRGLEYDLEASRLAIDIIRQEDHIPCPCTTLQQFARNKAATILSQTAYSRRNTLAVLESYAAQMAQLPGKRMIVLFSDGFTMRDRAGNPDNGELKGVIERAARSGVAIYAIDAGGIRPPPSVDASRHMSGSGFDDGPLVACLDKCGADDVECQNECLKQYPSEIQCNEIPQPICFSPRPGLLEQFVREFETESMNGMYELANGTGGRMLEGTNNLKDQLGRAFDDNRYYYILSYYVPESVERNKFRSLEVRIPKHPEYTVRAPKGFTLSDTTVRLQDDAELTPQQKLLRAMLAPLPVTELGVSAIASYIETEDDDRQVSLTVGLEGDGFKYLQQDARSAFTLEILSVIFDTYGNQVEGISAKVEGTLTPEGMNRAQAYGYRFHRRLALKPGMYQMRVGVREEGTERIGTAFTWVEVPEVTPKKFEMSSLVLSNPLEEMQTGNDSFEVSNLETVRMVQGVPVYERGDVFYYTYRVHRVGDARAGSKLMRMREVLQGGKPIREEPWEPVDEQGTAPDGKGWSNLDGELDIKELSPGAYELRVSVKDAGTDETVRRTVAFGIE